MVFVNAVEMAKSLADAGKVALYGIHFDTDKDLVRPDSQPALAEIAKLLSANPQMKLHVVGHTDDQGKPDYNLDLSRRRAAKVVQELSTKNGVAANRLDAFGAGLYAPVAQSGTTTLTQTTLACGTFGRSNAKLQDGELFNYFIATDAYHGPSHLTFRGQTYYDLTWTCGISGWPGCSVSQTITANKGQYVVHETFQLHCFRIGCSTTNLSGSFNLNNDVFSIRPTTFGANTGYPYYAPGPLSGTGQVELAVKSTTDTIVTLASSDPSITVPGTVTITAGAFVADFTVDAVGIENGNPATTATIAATFPDGCTANLTVTDNSLPPPPDE